MLERTAAELVYSDYYEERHEGTGVNVAKHPVIDYQLGSVRDDFDFGSVLMFRSSSLHDYVAGGIADYHFAALYGFRLFLSRRGRIFHLDEYLYTEQEFDLRQSGERQFDYVNPRNREVR